MKNYIHYLNNFMKYPLKTRPNVPVRYGRVSPLIRGRLSGGIILFLILLYHTPSQAVTYPEITAQINESQVKQTHTFFATRTSRVAGYPGNDESAEYIYAQFQQIGLTEIKKEPFNLTVPVDRGGWIKWGDDNRIKLYSIWPNLVRTPTVPATGLSGELVYGDTGEIEFFTGKDIKGKLVLLEFNSGNNWVELAMMGAQAIIFIEPVDTNRGEAERKFLQVPMDVPRYWISQKDGTILKNKLSKTTNLTVTITAKMDWVQVPSWNILGTIPGYDKKLQSEIIVVSGYYDSMSVVPSLSPGSESACSITALLELARSLQSRPLARTVMFLATSGHFFHSRGVDAFIHSHTRKDNLFKSGITQPIDVKLFLGLELSSQHYQLGVWHASSDAGVQRYHAPFGKNFMEYTKSIVRETGLPSDILVNGISPEKGRTWRTYCPEEMLVDSFIMLNTGIPSLSFITVNDNRYSVDTPLDKVNKVNISNLTRQIQTLSCLLYTAVNDKNLFPEFELRLPDRLKTLRTRVVTFDPRTSYVPDDPVRGAVAFLRQGFQKSYLGVRGETCGVTDSDGYFEISRITRDGASVEGYVLDPDSGTIILAPDRGSNGDKTYPMFLWVDWLKKEHLVVLFPCVPTNVYDLIDPRYLTLLDRIDIFDAANSVPFVYGNSMPTGIPWGSSYCEPCAVVYTEPKTQVKLAFGSGPLGMRLLLLNSDGYNSKEQSEGDGFIVGEDKTLIETAWQSAKDMYNLNQYRIKNLVKFGIANDRLEELHKKAADSLIQANNAKKSKSWTSYLKFSRRALGIESRAYPDVMATANDVIKGIIFYMILIIPTAYFLERLLLGFPDIKKQIAGVVFVFLIIYLIVRTVHPAFQITNMPEIILLAFLIFILSIIVLSIVIGKFESQMQKMRRERIEVYETDVGRISATGTAFTLGIANMNRRKTRTFLTCITLVLLTFTVLSFTSVRSYLKFTQIARTNKPLYEGFLIRNRAWDQLIEPAYTYIKNEFADQHTIVPRAWYISKNRDEKTFLRIDYQNNNVYATGIVGLTPQEKDVTRINQYLVTGNWFTDTEERTCILPSNLANRLKISLSSVEQGTAEIQVLGSKLKVIGIFDSDKIQSLKDLDDEPLTPVDFVSTGQETVSTMRESQQQGTGAETEQMRLETFTHLPYENVVFLPYKLVMNSNGALESVAVLLTGSENVTQKIEEFISRLGATLFAGVKDKVTVYSSLSLTSFSGLGQLFIPILIAALIVLNTMLGSVYERIREIGIFSSVGLAPVHIASLFIAESCVYAVLGAVGGYLVGQVIAKILSVSGILAGLTLNYSSVSAVMSTLIVMLVVFLSTIYPAQMASRLAVPDVTRKWSVPNPVGDEWNFDFPFTVSSKEVLGMFVFLRNYFASYEEESVGTFYTDGARLTKFATPEGEGYKINMNIWLAPFDLGVSQAVELNAVPSIYAGIYEVKVYIRRLSGEMSNWQRLNRRLLNILRKQFLIWKTVPVETKQKYRDQGEKTLT